MLNQRVPATWIKAAHQSMLWSTARAGERDRSCALTSRRVVAATSTLAVVKNSDPTK
jgi:hypothetical protein